MKRRVITITTTGGGGMGQQGEGGKIDWWGLIIFR